MGEILLRNSGVPSFGCAIEKCSLTNWSIPYYINTLSGIYLDITGALTIKPQNNINGVGISYYKYLWTSVRGSSRVGLRGHSPIGGIS